MNKLFKQSIILFALILILIFPYFVFAQNSETDSLNPLQNLGQTAKDGGYNTDVNDPNAIIGVVITAVLGLLGIIFLVLIIYAGYLWMTAGGDSDKVTKAKDILRTSIIGLILVISAYAITQFILIRVVQETGVLN
jgi:hypothetical protein